MSSKEEIESSFKIIETICDEEICLFNKTIVQGNVNQIKRYIDQLESDKQKLIDKLEEEHTIAKTKYSETLSSFQYGRLEVIEEILEILKGEKDELQS